ncbi:hypothetical protein TNCT_134281 [Trichonephila clavata]|uniref:Uncharacterized protein n=1 Tax=Trichonephila clavata TaxID=2740835 RepID=A0A8X6HGA8_TRICU|nr:hypothetical protein TNCT_134281 [Trichonephila clavata]
MFSRVIEQFYGLIQIDYIGMGGGSYTDFGDVFKMSKISPDTDSVFYSNIQCQFKFISVPGRRSGGSDEVQPFWALLRAHWINQRCKHLFQRILHKCSR